MKSAFVFEKLDVVNTNIVLEDKNFDFLYKELTYITYLLSKYVVAVAFNP